MFFHLKNEQLSLDQYIQLLQRMDPTQVYGVDDADNIASRYVVEGSAMVQRLVVNDHNLRADISIIASERQHWGRVVAHATRVVAVANRLLRIWKAKQELALREAHKLADEKPPSKELIEATYRVAPGYADAERMVEKAQESLMALDVIYGAFQAKEKVLLKDVFTAADGSLQRRSP